MRKEMVGCLWFGVHCGNPLQTRKGNDVEVISPGWWDVDENPDETSFIGVKALFGGEECKYNKRFIRAFCYVRTSEVPENFPEKFMTEDGDFLLVVAEDDDKERDFDCPVIAFFECMDEEEIEQLNEIFDKEETE